jgi:hypothetical protein
MYKIIKVVKKNNSLERHVYLNCKSLAAASDQYYRANRYYLTPNCRFEIVGFNNDVVEPYQDKR